MSDWRPDCSVERAAERAALIAEVRAWFADAGVLAVDTPALAAKTVTDPRIESLRLTDGRYLQTSPEYYMKRLLAAGYPDIYSICRVFRGAESGRRHLSEFTMIEWYRRGMALDAIVDDTTALISAVVGDSRLASEAQRIDYRDAFIEHAGVDPHSATPAALADAAKADDSLVRSLGDDRDAFLDLVLANVVAPGFPDDRLTVLTHFPASQAALARRCPSDDRVADRFEVFCGDLELANGYVELTDADEQAERIERDIEVRRGRGAAAIEPDSQFLAALAAGLPQCSGVALGFERLHMVVAGCDHIREVVTFTGDA